jgi:hypothetical protein
MEAWRQRRSGKKKKRVQQNQTRIPLTPTGLLMEGHFTSVRFSFAFLCANERAHRLE